MMKMFAIPNCNTVKKARTYLESKGITYEFIDFKKTPPTSVDIERWASSFGAIPINKQGLTYKKYKDTFEGLNPKEQVKFVAQNPSMIKRPILEKNEVVLCFGFDESIYGKLK